MESPINHYYQVVLPLLSALDAKERDELVDALSEMDYLIETLSYADISADEQEETALTYWAWWEKVRQKVGL